MFFHCVTNEHLHQNFSCRLFLSLTLFPTVTNGARMILSWAPHWVEESLVVCLWHVRRRRSSWLRWKCCSSRRLWKVAANGKSLTKLKFNLAYGMYSCYFAHIDKREFASNQIKRNDLRWNWFSIWIGIYLVFRTRSVWEKYSDRISDFRCDHELTNLMRDFVQIWPDGSFDWLGYHIVRRNWWHYITMADQNGLS